MNCPQLDKAAKLLAKAQSTTFDAEAVACLEKCCRLLSSVVSGASAAAGEPDPGCARCQACGGSGGEVTARLEGAYHHFDQAPARPGNASRPHVDIAS